MHELLITNRPLKNFLSLFNKDEELTDIELGDVWHPSSGFVDESYFKGINTVNDLLAIDYDFYGLVHFVARIRGLLVEYYGDDYKITGSKKEIEKLKYGSANGRL